MASFSTVATSNSGKLGLKNPTTSTGRLILTHGPDSVSDTVSVGAQGRLDSSLLSTGLALSNMLTRRGADTGVALGLKPSCFL